MGLCDGGCSGPRRLYLASRGFIALDLTTRRVTQPLRSKVITHGVLPVGAGIIAVADSTQRSVEFVNGKTGTVLKSVSVAAGSTVTGWHDPDALLFEARSGLLVAVEGDSGRLALIDIATRALVDTITVGGELEFAAADGTGLIYVNETSKAAIGVVDVRKRLHVRDILLRGCEEPTGLAFDDTDRLLISVCDNGVLKVVDPVTGAEMVSLPVGKGSDAVMYDEQRHIVFSAGGKEGTLSIVSIRDRKHIAVVQTLATQPGARLGALDPQTGRLYLPVAGYDKAAPPLNWPGLPPIPRAIAGSFKFLVVAAP